jgi:hypothetical protein
MRLVVIFAAGPVRHMSVRAGARAGETTDNHGQRPCEPANSRFSYVLTEDGQWFSSREQR